MLSRGPSMIHMFTGILLRAEAEKRKQATSVFIDNPSNALEFIVSLYT